MRSADAQVVCLYWRQSPCVQHSVVLQLSALTPSIIWPTHQHGWAIHFASGLRQLFEVWLPCRICSLCRRFCFSPSKTLRALDWCDASPVLHAPAFRIYNYLGLLCVTLYGIVFATFVSTRQSLYLLVSFLTSHCGCECAYDDMVPFSYVRHLRRIWPIQVASS